jgi:hypothetical protein
MDSSQGGLELRHIKSPATELADHGVPLETRCRDGNLAPHEPVLARAHLRTKSGKLQRLRRMSHSASNRRTSGYMLGPDLVHRLARDRQPAARLTRDLDQRCIRGRRTIRANTDSSD